MKSRRVKRSKKGSKTKRIRKMSTRYTYFQEEGPHDEERIKNCHKWRWVSLPGGVRVQSRPPRLWCKEAKHYLKSLKKTKRSRSRK